VSQEDVNEALAEAGIALPGKGDASDASMREALKSYYGAKNLSAKGEWLTLPKMIKPLSIGCAGQFDNLGP